MKTLTTLTFILLLAVPAFAQRPSELNIVQTDSNMPVGAVASSTVAPGYPASSVVNADTTGRGWGTGISNGSGWNSNERFGSSTFTLTFGRTYLLTEIVTYGLRGDPATIREPAEGETSVYANKSFTVSTSEDCTNYSQFGAVTNNSLVINHFVAPVPVLAKCVKLVFDNSGNAGGYSRLIEEKVYGKQ